MELNKLQALHYLAPPLTEEEEGSEEVLSAGVPGNNKED